MLEQRHRYELRNRYLFTGKLLMQTALHIGGGKVTLSSSDSPVVLTPEEIPFIPGSSFKGSLRSTVEKLVPGLPGEWSSCALIEVSDEEAKQAKEQNKRVCPTVRQKDITKKRRDHPGQEEKLRARILKDLCHTCQLFGSPFAAARMAINDLYMPEGTWHGILQMRDGVAIDRDSEKAKDRLKYDFEVVPASATFDLAMTLENATAQDLQLISVGLSEFVHGFGTIGGKRSRGLGACLLNDLQVYLLELSGVDERERNERLRNYLLGKKPEQKFHSKESGEQFLNKHITSL
jgi:CRISPR-associated RAMP protein (TIGR02581 family)